MDGDREILQRLDAHMERSNECMARGNELMEEIREEHRLNREMHERTIKAMFDLSERQEHFFRDVLAETVGAIRQIGDEMREDMRLVRERMEAQTEAIFRIIDRLDGNGGAASS